MRLSQGTLPSEWTREQHQDHFQRMLGGKFRAGTQAPPAQNRYYQPGPSDHSEPVVGADGTVIGWQPNPNYRPQA